MHLFEKKIPASLERECFGLRFPHPVGIAPGLDPEGRRYNAFRRNASFVEIGPLMPSDDAGARDGGLRRREANDTPDSLKEAILYIQDHTPRTLLAANIAPVPSRPNCESSTRDLLKAFTFMYDFADMFIVDTFRKNNDGVAPFQSAEYLAEAMDALIDMRFCYEKSKPILIRIDSDIQQGSLAGLLDYMMYSGLDGIIAGHGQYALDLVRRIGYFTGGRFPVIACGGIDSPDKADALFLAGATLIQTDKKNARLILNHLIEQSATL